MARILVIDDDALVRDTISLMLRLEGHEVALAPHGREGLQRLQEQPFDLVISDIVTPRRRGLETVSAIRRTSTLIPIIVMTGDPGDAPDLDRARRAGATATIPKPFKPRDLFALIRQCLTGEGPPAT